MMENLKLWNSVQDVDLKFTKKVTVAGKQPFTNVDTYELIRMATDKFGSYGSGWGVSEMVWSEKEVGDTTMLILDLIFFFPNGQFPYRNMIKSIYKTKSGYMRIDEDAPKKIITNSIGKCLSMLGFASAIYRGQFEDAGYMEEMIYDAVQLIQPNQVQILLKGISYYKADKNTVLTHFGITHLKDLPLAKMNECEALIKKMGEKNA